MIVCIGNPKEFFHTGYSFTSKYISAVTGLKKKDVTTLPTSIIPDCSGLR